VSSLPKERQSKLAKEHNISARQEREIKEAFALFAEPMDGEKEGVIPIDDVRRAMVYVLLTVSILLPPVRVMWWLGEDTSSVTGPSKHGPGRSCPFSSSPTSPVSQAIMQTSTPTTCTDTSILSTRALGVPPTKPELREFREILDPEEEGYASYEPFLAICALKLHAKEDDFEGPESDAHRQEVDEAFRLFTSTNNSAGASGLGGGGGEILTLAHLKRVAMTLKQDIDEALLKDMILEANSGAGVGKGVRRDEFEEVMRRAGAWK